MFFLQDYRVYLFIFHLAPRLVLDKHKVYKYQVSSSFLAQEIHKCGDFIF